MWVLGQEKLSLMLLLLYMPPGVSTVQFRCVSLPQCTDYSYSLTHAEVILFWEIGERVSSFSLFIFSFYFVREGT